MHLSRRQLLEIPVVASVAAGLPSIASAATAPKVTGAYNQVTADGQFVRAGFEGAEHALAAYAAMYDVTRADAQRRTAIALLEFVLGRQPNYMGTYLGRQLLRNSFLRRSNALKVNLNRFVDDIVGRFARNPDSVLRAGDIRTLSGRAELLIDYARNLEQGDRSEEEISYIETASRAMLDRLAELQFTRSEATSRFGSERFTGAFPHLVTGDDGSMGSWDVTTWALAMLSLDQYEAIRALAKGYGRFRDYAYNNAAAAGTRQLLATSTIDPSLIYAGAPAGFPLDGAEFVFGDEGGEQQYLVTYGWSPNAIAQLGSVLNAVRVHRVTVPESPSWHNDYWVETPMPNVLDPHRFWAGLEAKVRFTHDFLEATQLPVSADFPWIDLDRTTFPSTGTEDFRRGGWFDGSGRGTMSAVYSRLAIVGYVDSGGRNTEALTRAGEWWNRLVIWE